MRRKTLKEKLLAIFLAVAVAVTMIPGGFALFTQEADAANTISLTGKKFEYKDAYGEWHTTTHFAGGGYEGLCAAAHRHSITGKHTYTMATPNATMIKLAYYYGYQKGWTSGVNGAKLSRAFNYVSTDSKTKDRGKAFNFKESTLKDMVNTVKNVKVPEGFTAYYVTPTGNTSKQAGMIWKYVPNGTLTMVKTSAVTGYNPSYAGCVYTVYSGSKSVGTFTINASGKTTNLSLPAGKYTVKETKTNANYKLDATSHSVTITSGKKTTLSVKEDATGNLSLKKSFTPDSDEGYTLAGFKFHLVNTASSKITYDGTTDANGNLNISNLKAGTYKISEELTTAQKKAGYGCEDEKQNKTITIANGKTNSLTWKNSYVKGNYLEVEKRTGDNTTVEGFHFTVEGDIGARELSKDQFLTYAHIETKTTKDGFTLGEFTVNEEELADLNNAAKNKETGTSTVHVTATATKPAEQVEGKALDTFKDGDSDNYVFVDGDALSYRGKVYIAQGEGTYTIDEIEGNETDSVLENEEHFKVFEAGEDETETISIPVQVTLKSVKEKEDVTNPTTPNSIAEPEGWEFGYNDITWPGSADTYSKDDEETTTGPTGKFRIKDLLPGTYTVTEVLNEEQAKHFIAPEPQTMTLAETTDGSEPEPLIFEVFTNEPKWTDVTLKKTNAKEGGTVEGFEFTLTGTRAFDGEAVNVTAATEEDGTIDFGKLYAGEYVLEETGFDPEVYMFHKAYKLEGHENPAKAFTITGEEEEPIEIDFENDPITNLYITKVDKDTQMFLQDAEFDLYEGDKKVVTFKITRGESGKAIAQILWKDEDSEIYAETDDVEDTGEEPEPNVVDETTPDNGSNTDSESGSDNSGNVSTMADETTPVDTENAEGSDTEGNSGDASSEEVQYNYAVLKALKRNTEYRIVETKSPQGYAGTVDYGFTFTEDMAPIIIENKAPEITTTAKDSKTGQHLSNPAGPVTIIDTVAYKDLTPGKEYTMTAKFVLKPQTDDEVAESSENAQVVKVDGKEVTNTIKFTPKEKDGTVDVPLTFDASDLEGAKTVIFESLGDPKLEEENSIIATHSEVDNEDQSIYFPEVHTSAKAEDTNMNITGASDETTIIDTVEYSNVIAGKVYEMKGVLMSKETGKPITVDGEPVTASVKFKATEEGPDYNDLTEDEQSEATSEQPADGQEGQEGEQADDASKVKLVSGSVELEFTFDSTEFAGDSLVAFEELYSQGKLVGQHKDIKDKKQTVRIPIIGTKASSGRNVIKDKVAYKNLEPGKTYIMRGVMMDKKTGEPMTIDGEELSSELEFTPSKPNGIVTLEFEVDTKKLKGKTLVAFEKCFVVSDETEEEVEIASHENLDSKAQTVTFRTPQTGQVLPWFIFAALAAMVASAGYMLRKKFLLK